MQERQDTSSIYQKKLTSLIEVNSFTKSATKSTEQNHINLNNLMYSTIEFHIQLISVTKNLDANLTEFHFQKYNPIFSNVIH